MTNWRDCCLICNLSIFRLAMSSTNLEKRWITSKVRELFNLRDWYSEFVCTGV